MATSGEGKNTSREVFRFVFSSVKYSGEQIRVIIFMTCATITHPPTEIRTERGKRVLSKTIPMNSLLEFLSKTTKREISKILQNIAAPSSFLECQLIVSHQVDATRSPKFVTCVTRPGPTLGETSHHLIPSWVDTISQLTKLLSK